MSFPIAGSSTTLDVDLTSAQCGGTATGAIDLTPQQISDLMGGSILNWDSPELRNNGENAWLASCNEPVSRVVRYDDAGTTGILKGYFLNVDPNRTGATCDPSPWSNYDNPTLANNAVWPTNGTATGTGDGSGGTGVGYTATSTCSAIVSGTTSGGPALLQTLVNTPGGIGYADLSDAELDAGNLPGGGTGLFNSVLIRSAVESATNPGSYVLPQNIKGANCDFSALSLPDGGAATGMVGLDVTGTPDTWADDNTVNHENATDQGSLYPICGLTFDLVYSGLSANTGSAIADLSADQRRTLYSYMVFILSSTAQSLLPTDYYASLPSAWLPAIVSGFQANF
jgi:ABC-type phosphate transport system substrate-binding protein